ncbi:hypothetical protein [Pseudomonas sp. RT6P73]
MSDFTEMKTCVAIIGGGMAGALAAVRLGMLGVEYIIIDEPLPAADEKIGGFARFSGAKFSLPPAGLGLVPIAGTLENLQSVISQILIVLGLQQKQAAVSTDTSRCASEIKELRKYDSIVLLPDEIESLLNKLELLVSSKGSVVYGRATEFVGGSRSWLVKVLNSGGHVLDIKCESVFYSAGRLSNGLLLDAGAQPTDGKGIDVGVRVEFLNKDALQNLRAMGPDAKIIKGACRTFCLNSPGHIYRYEHSGISIPGGVVAEQAVLTANVGLLMRLKNKSGFLRDVWPTLKELDSVFRDSSKIIFSGGTKFGLQPVMRNVFGDKIASEIEGFAEYLIDGNLWDKSYDYRIHLPLLDWHWSTFAIANSHQTTVPGLYALGDSSGHARGLLQAGASGWLAAEEYANAC